MPPPTKKSWPFRIEYPPELPISARVDEIVAAIQQHQVLVLAGETGSGKTTQIPKMCLAAGCGSRGRIACTQPRRVAATSVSRRVAEEVGVEWGREVGCKIRFADQTSRDTTIKFMTDGMLLAELQADPLLREYDTVIVDEAHERSLNIDFILGHLRRLRTRRPDLKIVVTSATIDTEAFSKAFDDAPVIEVSGRTYPVEVIYAPLEEMAETGAPDAGSAPEAKKETGRSPAPKGKGRGDEYTYLDAAVEAVERVLRESATGDVLVFLPTERDIREAGDLLDGRKLRGVEVVPLFGRLTNAEQQRVFAPTPARKVVVATNIAETSLTIPGIRFVIDTGLARISRYVPQSRTRRLPVEPVSQSSADQRKGRCGRVSDGVCIRLYSEQDYNDRPRFTQPEIQRSNLADVILRMKAFGLGDIEEFPFLNAPPAKGVRGGYALLHELGALEAGDIVPASDETATPAYPQWRLTELGRELAHLPVDPTLARMVLQAREEKALREVLIIAAALSIQDPRERPLDQQAKADAAHRRFTHPDSDFLTLLAIWEAYHDEFERMTLGKLRKFCTAHFLSFTRMREWRDVHGQLVETIETREGFADTSVFSGGGDREARPAERSHRGRPNAVPTSVMEVRMNTPAYRAIHRCILAGLLGNIAMRAHDGTWHATHDRKVGVFPGSVLFEKTAGAKPGPGRAPAGEPVAGKRAAKWLMAAEIMETGRVYARTCARIDPQWALELGSHLLRASHSEPFWDERAGRVLVKERRRLYNLELDVRAVGYGRIQPEQATEIFIREGLVGDTITWPFDFLAHNRRLREKTEAVLTRARSAGYMNVDEAMYRFYAARLRPDEAAETPGVSSVPELIDLVRHRQATEPKFLFMAEGDLRTDVEHDTAAFPEQMPMENRVLPLAYAYKPGRDDDGVTVRVSAAEAAALTDAALDWAVPGHWRDKIEFMLKALPKEQRRALIPLAEASAGIADQIGLIATRKPPPTLAEALAEMLTERLGVRIDPSLWADKPLPPHLRVRVEVVNPKGGVLAAGRDLAAVRTELSSHREEMSQAAARDDSAAWKRARARWETAAASEWKFGDLPAEIAVAEHGGVTVSAYPGLRRLAEGVAVRLFATRPEAEAATRDGVAALLAILLRHDLGWLEKDLRDLRALGPLVATLCPLDDLQQQAHASISRWVCARSVPSLSADAFGRELAAAKAALRGIVPKLVDWLREILELRLALQTHKTPYPGMANDLAALIPRDFVACTPFARLVHLPRYLKGMQARAERWKRDPAKDAQRARELQPFVQAAERPEVRATEFRWLVEELRVSLFAQELGTAEPVSGVRLQRALQDLAAAPGGSGGGGEPVPARAPVALPAKGRTVLKSLEALGRFRPS